MNEHRNALIGITAGLAMLREAIALHCEEQALSICDQLQATADEAIAATDGSHDELVAACEAALERIEAHGNAPDLSGWIRQQDDEAITKITAALAKARG